MGRQTEFSLYLQPAFFSFPQCFPLTFESVSFTQRKISSKTPSSSFLEVEVTTSVSRTVTAAFYFRPSKSVPFSDLASTQVWSSLLLSYHLVHFFPIFFLWFQSLDSSQLPPIKKKKKTPWVLEKFGIKGEKWKKKLEANKEVSKGPPRELAVLLKWANGVTAARGPGRWLWSFGHMRSPAEHTAALVCLPELKPQKELKESRAGVNWSATGKNYTSGSLSLCTSVGCYPRLWCAWCIHTQLNNIRRKQGRSHRTWLA